MALNILFFGKLSDQFGSSLQMDLPDGVRTISELTNWLEKQNNTLGILTDESIKIMANQSLIAGDYLLKGDEEIGYLPPVGGG